MKVSELIGDALELWVAKVCEIDAVLSDFHPNGTRSVVVYYSRNHDGVMNGRSFSPSTEWSDGGPLLDDKCCIGFRPLSDAEWMAEDYITGATGRGPTQLIAAMRAIVASVYDDDVPDEIKMPGGFSFNFAISQ